MPAEPRRGRRRTGLVVAGLASVVGSLVVAVGCGVVAALSTQLAIDDLARAPGGCTTTLQVSEPGRFAVFLESEGRIEGLSGGCRFPEGSFRSAATVDDVDLTAVDADGAALQVLPSGGDDYRMGGSAGARIATLVVDEPTTVQLTVSSDVEGAVVAVGLDPADAAAPWRVAAVVVVAVGLVVGAPLIIFGLRRRAPTAPAGRAATNPWGPPGQ